MDEGDVLRMHCIYERPADYPNHYVVRAWDVAGGVPVPVPELDALLADTLEQARGFIPAGRINIGREPGDDPAIYEVWI